MLSDAERLYHLRQYDTPYRSTFLLADFIRSKAGGELTGPVMDVGCGGGANLHWLSTWRMLEGARVLGVDQDRELLDIAREHNPSARFVCADFLGALPSADFVLSLQVLSFIEDWRAALARLLEATRRMLFVSSLFWDGVATHTHASDAGHTGAHYNVIAADDFVAACAPRLVDWLPYVSDPPLYADHTKLGTYTIQGRDFSGPLFLPWRLVAVRMPESE